MRLSGLFFFAFIFIEIWSIIAVGNRLGALATFMLLVAGFILGSQLIRYQGMRAIISSMQKASQSESPLLPIMEGLLKSFAGILFIIPGFVTDAFAILLLLPFIRRLFARYLMTRGMFKAFASGGFQTGFGGFQGLGRGQGFGKGQGFGRGANDDLSGGNVYEHEAPPKDPEVQDRLK
jgi:UPF0716 protein FxsA